MKQKHACKIGSHQYKLGLEDGKIKSFGKCLYCKCEPSEREIKWLKDKYETDQR